MLLAERLQSPDHEMFWHNIGLMLHISSSITLKLQEVKGSLPQNVACGHARSPAALV